MNDIIMAYSLRQSSINFSGNGLHGKKEGQRKYCKKVFLKFSQYSQENTCAGVSF